MNLCKLRNKAERMVCRTLGLNSKGYPEQEVDILNVLFWVCFATVFFVLITWWVFLLRYIFQPLTNMRFRCDEK